MAPFTFPGGDEVVAAVDDVLLVFTELEGACGRLDVATVPDVAMVVMEVAVVASDFGLVTAVISVLLGVFVSADMPDEELTPFFPGLLMPNCVE